LLVDISVCAYNKFNAGAESVEDEVRLGMDLKVGEAVEQQTRVAIAGALATLGMLRLFYVYG